MEAFAIVCSRRAREPGAALSRAAVVSSEFFVYVARSIYRAFLKMKIVRLKRRHTTTRPALVPAAAPVQASAAAPTSNHAPPVGSRRLDLR